MQKPPLLSFRPFHFLVASLLLAAASTLRAGTFTVTNTNATGTGSLRKALGDAEISAGADTILFEAVLSGQSIPINTPITVSDTDGVTVDASALPAGIVVDGGTGTHRLFFITAGSNLTLIAVAITGGDGDGTNSPGLGGAIFNAGTLILSDCHLHDNTASANGGAIHSTGTATLTRCTLNNNSTTASGGALSNAGTLTATNCTVVGNSAGSAAGGGGGVNATSAATSTTLIHCTLTGNQAANGAGGGARRAGGTLTVRNCIVAENTAATAGLENLGNAITQEGSNFVSTNAPGLAVLGLQGGRVPTRPPLSTSTVIDAVAAGNEDAGVTTDARGHGRALDGNTDGTGTPDIGAVEFIPTTFLLVENTNDAGVGSLRQAIANAALLAGADALTFASTLSGQTITLTTDQLELNSDVTLDASVLAEPLRIHGNDTFRIFNIPPGFIVNLHSLVLTHGHTSSNGGAIDNQSTLTVTNCTIMNNVSGWNGGGIHNGGLLSIERSTISGNTAPRGGGIFSYAASPFVGNVNLYQCTISGNTAIEGGGGIVNVNFNMPSATAWLMCVNCTIANNRDDGTWAGGIMTLTYGGPATTELTNTLVAGNAGRSLFTEGAGATCVSWGGNLASDNGGGFLTPAAGDLIHADPRLGPLADNGGPTQTMALQVGSPALDAALGGWDFPTDQRGLPRSRDGDAVAGAPQDIGAYEAQVAPVGSLGFKFSGSGSQYLIAVESAGAPGFAQTSWSYLGGNQAYVNGPHSTPGGVSSGNVQIWWGSPYAPALSGTPTTPDQKLMFGYLDSNGTANSGTSLLNEASQPFFAINDLSAAYTLGGFRVVVYAQAQGSPGSVGEYWLSSFASPEDVSATYDLGPHFFLATPGGDFDGTYTRATSTTRTGAAVANYMVFDAITDSGFILRTEDYPSPRAPINAVQIVRNEIIMVTTEADENDLNGTLGTGISLREALRDAPPGAGILFDPAVFTGGAANVITFAAASPGLVVSQNVTIDASNIPGGITVNGSGSSSYRKTVLTVLGGRVASLRGVTLTGGYTGENTYGGGLLNQGSVTMTECRLTNNTADTGAGAASLSNVSPTRLLLRRCTVSGNIASFGGGLINWAAGGRTADLRLQDCAVTGNQGTNGGGIYNYSVGGTARATLLSTTLHGNVSVAGGGLFNSSAASTASCIMTLSHCTVSGNVANNEGGGCFLAENSGTVTVSFANSILAGNTAGSMSPELSIRYGGEGATFGRNVVGQDPSIAWPSLDIIVTNPLLAPLGDYGGPTQTMALLRGSPARNASLSSTAKADQRGFPMVGTADIGAYEAGTSTHFNAWAWETLPATATVAQHAPDHDYDRDGRSLLMEYAFLSDPNVPNAPAPLPFTMDAAGTLATLVIPYRPGVPNLTCTIDRSTDLVTWTTIVTVNHAAQTHDAMPGVSLGGSTSSTMTFTDSFNDTGFAGQQRVFYRLRVTQ